MPDKEHVVHRKSSRTMKDYIRMAADPTEEELEQRRAAERKRFESIRLMMETFEPIWAAEDRERLYEWGQALVKAGGITSELDLAEFRRILGDAIAKSDVTTATSIFAVVSSDPELIKELGLANLVNSKIESWVRMTSGYAIEKLGISRSSLSNYKRDHPDWIKSDGHGWCMVSPECPRKSARSAKTEQTVEMT
jgi:hypothetical protein